MYVMLLYSPHLQLDEEFILSYHVHIHKQKEMVLLKYKTICKTKCYCISLCRASNAVNDYYDRAFAANGITTKQFSLLLNLSRMGEANVVELAEYVNLERSTVTRNLRILIFNGWVCDTAKENSRSHKYVVTKEGTAQIEACMPIWDRCQAEMQEIVGAENMEALADILYTLQNLQKEQ